MAEPEKVPEYLIRSAYICTGCGYEQMVQFVDGEVHLDEVHQIGCPHRKGEVVRHILSHHKERTNEANRAGQ